MPRENNQASLSPSVRLLLLNGPLNGARWCLGALPGQMIDVAWLLRQELEGQGDRVLPEVPSELPCGAVSTIPDRGPAGWPLALAGPSDQPALGQLHQGIPPGEGSVGCRGTGRDRQCQSWWGEEALSPHLELVEGKIVCDDAAPEPSARR